LIEKLTYVTFCLILFSILWISLLKKEGSLASSGEEVFFLFFSKIKGFQSCNFKKMKDIIPIDSLKYISGLSLML